MKLDEPTLAREEKPQALPELVEFPESPEVPIPEALVPADSAAESMQTKRPESTTSSATRSQPKESPRTASVDSESREPEPSEQTAFLAPRASGEQVVETAMSVSGPVSAELPCHPHRRFVFTHPNVPDALELVDCLPSEGGYKRLDAPPLTNQLVLMVQTYLNDLGQDAGPTDGLIGPRTRGAIRRFQLSVGRRSTGMIDFELLRDLHRLRNVSTGDGE
jgi:hypothetical protein